MSANQTAAYRREWRRGRRAMRKLLGLCWSCSSRAQPGRTRCFPCARADARRAAARAHAKKAAASAAE